GEVCDKVFRNPHGWHVIKLENRRPAQRFADFKRDEPRLREAMTQQRVQLYIQDLMQKAKITPAAGAAPKAPAKKAAAK
ncbi:MAG: hypothetical protein HUK26_05640, partial [Duodenibacillus sp.]|nr:hypothetical protein [Duodenibacillus sp.]